jgi:hypothetical protein
VRDPVVDDNDESPAKTLRTAFHGPKHIRIEI